jgi:hypothetical protein
MSDHWPMWVIYFDPLDYPKKFVVRTWWIGAGKLEAELGPIVRDSLREAREALPPEASTRLNRAPVDEKVIVELWF